MDRTRIIKVLSKAKIKADGTRTTFDVSEELGRGGNGVAFVVRSARKELVAKFYVPPDSRDLDQAAFKRFQREMGLTARVNHPYVVPSQGLGNVQVGSYQIPFYLMPRADGTMRDLMPRSFTLTDIGERLRAFTRSLQGVAYLHHLGIIHRDLKPENILLFNKTPKIADLGIAHVSPGFINWSQLTVPQERLMNRDYYAPEQRHGDATKVDHRADIYALGCILYEIISGISPTRPNLPPLREFHRELAPLDQLLSRMMAHDPSARYPIVDLVIDDLQWSLVQMGMPTGGPSTEEDDKRTLIKLLSSTNAANQAMAIEPATRLGAKALPLLHEQIGNRRPDVVSAAYRILREMAHESSVPYLTAGLYPRRTAKKPRFLTGQLAASALENYPAKIRLAVLDSISDQVRAEDIVRLIDNLEPEECYPRLARLYQDKMFYRDWGERGELSLLLQVDEDKSWPLVEELMSGDSSFYVFMVFRDIYPYVNTDRQRQIIDHYLYTPRSLSSWELPNILEALAKGGFPIDYLTRALDRIGEVEQIVFKRYAEREEFDKKLQREKAKLLGAA